MLHTDCRRRLRGTLTTETLHILFSSSFCFFIFWGTSRGRIVAQMAKKEGRWRAKLGRASQDTGNLQQPGSGKLCNGYNLLQHCGSLKCSLKSLEHKPRLKRVGKGTLVRPAQPARPCLLFQEKRIFCGLFWVDMNTSLCKAHL